MPEPRYQVASLERAGPLLEDEWAAWHPVRHHFGIRAFGVNLWLGRREGDEVIEEHDERESGHEELYTVLAGRARFTVDGDEVDAPAGTFVYVPSGVSRVAVAAEPDTRVLAVGATPGVAFEPTAWDLRHTRDLPRA